MKWMFSALATAIIWWEMAEVARYVRVTIEM